jgi:hypothetical protein
MRAFPWCVPPPSRRRLIGFFLKLGLLDDSLSESMLGWQHSGFSVEAGTRVYDDSARQSLAEYIVRRYGM